MAINKDNHIPFWIIILGDSTSFMEHYVVKTDFKHGFLFLLLEFKPESKDSFAKILRTVLHAVRGH